MLIIVSIFLHNCNHLLVLFYSVFINIFWKLKTFATAYSLFMLRIALGPKVCVDRIKINCTMNNENILLTEWTGLNGFLLFYFHFLKCFCYIAICLCYNAIYLWNKKRVTDFLATNDKSLNMRINVVDCCSWKWIFIWAILVILGDLHVHNEVFCIIRLSIPVLKSSQICMSEAPCRCRWPLPFVDLKEFCHDRKSWPVKWETEYTAISRNILFCV